MTHTHTTMTTFDVHYDDIMSTLFFVLFLSGKYVNELGVCSAYLKLSKIIERRAA